MSHYSVCAPVAPLRSEHLLPYAALVQISTAHRLWQGQTFATDPHQMLAAVAAAGFRVPVGIGVTLMPLRHPLEAAMQARTLAAITGHPAVAGFGPGAEVLQTSLLGRPYRSPLSATREYLRIVRAGLQGKVLDDDGAYFTGANTLAGVPAPPVEVGVGVLRPRMAELAGELADVVITWLTPARYLAEVLLPAVRRGAERAGRSMPRLVCMVPVTIPRGDARASEAVLSANGGHLMLPHYRDMLTRSGVTLHDDEHRTAESVVQAGAHLCGPVDEVTDRLREYEACGADEIVLNTAGALRSRGVKGSLEDVEEILAEVAA